MLQKAATGLFLRLVFSTLLGNCQELRGFFLLPRCSGILLAHDPLQQDWVGQPDHELVAGVLVRPVGAAGWAAVGAVSGRLQDARHVYSRRHAPLAAG